MSQENVEATRAAYDHYYSRVAAVVQRGRPRGSDTPVESHWWQVVTFRDGGVARVEMFSERAQALEAAGLSE